MISGLTGIMSLACALVRDLDGRILLWSSGAAALYGWPVEAALGRNTHQMLLTRFPEHPDQIHADLLREGQWYGEVEQRAHDGQPLRVASHWLLLQASDAPLVIEINHDIAGFTTARPAEAYLAAIVASADDAIISKTLDGIITSWNDAAEALLGWSAGDMLGRPIALTIPQDRLAEEVAVLARIRNGERVRHVETIRRRRDGTVVPVSLTVSPIHDDSGRVIGAGSIMRDLTERQRAEQAQSLSDAIVEASPSGMLLADADGTIRMVNREAERVFGYARAAMLGQPIEMLLPERWRDHHPKLRGNFLRAPQTRAMGAGRDLYGRRQDGSEVPVEIGLTPVITIGGVAVLATVVDITERKAAEAALWQLNETLEQRVAARTRELAEEMEARRLAEAALAQAQKLEAVGQLTGGVAHDFNNLLTVISGNLHFIAQAAASGEESTERVRRLVASSQRAVTRGAQLTAQLLAFARRQALQPEVVWLGDVVRDFSNLVQRAVGETVRLTVFAEPGLRPCELDPAQFESAVLNLALNARDAMPGGGSLSVTIANRDEAAAPDLPAGRYVAVTVADTGTGMTPEVAAHAVEPFFTTKEVGRGSGLGLSQVYGFVQQSGGALRIDTQPGAGTRVTLLFPAVAAPPPATASELRLGVLGLDRRIALLVVEDDAEVLELVEETLREHGHAVISAHDGREGLALLDQHPEVGAVLSDVVMPNGVSGVELACEARRRRPELPVMLMSGYPRDELERLGGTGTFAFLPKPFRPAELAAQVQVLLRGGTQGDRA